MVAFSPESFGKLTALRLQQGKGWVTYLFVELLS